MAETEWSTIEPGSPPEQEKVEFEIEGQEAAEAEAPEAEVETKAEEQQPEAKVEAEAPQEETTPTIEEEQEKETKGVETSGAQKRIRQLVKQKKEREAEIEKLLAQQKEMQTKLQQREEEYKNLLNNNVESNERQVTERLELARAAYRQAVESGDADNILKAQESLNTAQQDNYRLTEFRQQADSFEPQTFEEQQQPQTANVSEAQRKATNWAAANDWFNNDRVLTAVALEIDNAVQEEGFDPADDDYYEEIDRRMAEQFPSKFGQATKEVAAETPVAQETSTPAQVVAGASHTPAPSSSKKVKLSQEDVRLAEKWGISLEQYAAEKLKVEKAGEGEYTTINR
tara:strand:+ start:151 stop:1179 length:1029 start_codon:yes stop_codon:yes gene_type:complete